MAEATEKAGKILYIDTDLYILNRLHTVYML